MEWNHIYLAFGLTLFAGLATVPWYIVWLPYPFFFSKQIVPGYVFALVTGMMIYISFDELLPEAHMYGKRHTTIRGLISGIIVIGIGLMLL